MEISYELAIEHGANVAFLHGILTQKAVNNKITISQTELVELSGMSERTVRNILAKLIDLSLIKCIRKGKENTYQVRPLEVDSAGQQPEREPKQPYGAEAIVMLTPTEYAALIKDFGESKIKDYIERMEIQYHRSGKPYGDYNYMIRDWIKKDQNRPAYGKRKGRKKGGSLKKQEMQNIGQYLDAVEFFETDRQDQKKGDGE